MQFELRTHTPDVSPEWIEARNLFLQGRSREAWNLAASMKNRVPLQTANDFLLNMEIARACSVHQTYLALGRIAVRRFPDDVWVQFYHARILLSRRMFLDGIQYLKAREDTLGKTHPAQWAAAIANTYATAGFETSCLQWLEVAEQEADANAPLCLYTRASALEDLKKWDAALDCLRQCVQAAPDWVRARSYLIHCLLSRSHQDEAATQLAESIQRGHEDVWIEYTAALIPMSLGNFSLASERLTTTLTRWPQSDIKEYLRRTLCILLVELGQYSEAKQIVDGDEERFGFPEIPDAPVGRHCFIPLPLMAQNHNQCVPTTVAMAVSVDGHQYDPDVMFQEMHGREGTALWRAREWGNQHGLTTIPVVLEKDAIREMLDAGVPLIGTLEGPFNSHVDVVCGYNDDLETFYVRDPEHWAPFAMPWSAMESRYQLNNGLLALISNDRKDLIAKAEGFRSSDCTALLDLAHSVARGHVKSAELAYSAIADDSPCAFLRESHAINVVISPIAFRERMKLISQDKNTHPMAQFRSILALGPEDAQESLDLLLDEKQRMRSTVSRFLLLNQAMAAGDWTEAKIILDRLMVRGASVAAFWDMKSDILAELGDHVGSKQALDAAIELEPLRISTREKELSRNADRLKLQDYLREFEALLAEDPENKRLLINRAQILMDGPDGKAYEQAAKEALRWFPRSPDSYYQLLNWYEIQQRNDLVEKLLERGTEYLPEVFKKSDDEEEPKVDDVANADEKAAANTTTEIATAAVDHDALPDDNYELMEIVWKPSDPARPRALKEVMKRNQAGELPWHLVARLVAVQLLVPDVKDSELSPTADVLPQNPPGAPHWFVNAVYDATQVVEIPMSLAKDLEAWFRDLVPNIPDFPDVWFNQILLLESAQQKQEALKQLQELIERYPAKSSALYRLGVVADGQGDYGAARGYFERALEVNPGLMGAMNGLRDVYYRLNEQQLAHDCTLQMRRKLPHAIGYLRDEVLEVAELQTTAAADSLLEATVPALPMQEAVLLQAEVYIRTDRFKQASDQLKQLAISETDSDEVYEKWLRLSLMVAEQNNNTAMTLQLCEGGLMRWPDSSALKETKAGALAQSDPDTAARELKTILLNGDPQLETVAMYLQVSQTNPVDAAKQVIQDADEDRQVWLAELFTEAVDNSQQLQSYGELLEWTVNQFPDSDALLHRMVMHYLRREQVSKAVHQARKLYKRHPEHPEAARLLGQCLTDQDPGEALKYLNEAAEIDRNTSVLFDMARCYQTMGKSQKAMRLYREVIKTNPLLTSSWTNLFILGEPFKKLQPYMNRMLENGRGIHEEYFLVANVKVALLCKVQLPETWFALALQRWEILKTYPGYDDERDKLRKAIHAWIAHRPADLPKNHDEFSGFTATFKRWTAWMSWPGFRWIPRKTE